LQFWLEISNSFSKNNNVGGGVIRDGGIGMDGGATTAAKGKGRDGEA
jgi:hypothetical protein